MKKNDFTYNYFQRLTKDKDTAVKYYIDSTLNKTISMFHYENLPDTMPATELERILQIGGNAFITEVEGKIYALSGSAGGENDVYNNPTKYTVANPALNIAKEFTIGEDGILIKNDFLQSGLLPVIGKYAVLLTDVGISLNTVSVLSRLTMLLSASDDNTKKSCELFIEKILNGDFSVIGENAFLKGVNLQSIPSQHNSNITQLIELTQYYKSNLLCEIGLNSNFNMKRERLTETEVLLNNDELLPFVENMLTERRVAIEHVNEKFGTEISVELKSSWKTEHENNDKANEALETETEIEVVTRETDETDENTETTETEETEETEETNETEENK